MKDEKIRLESCSPLPSPSAKRWSGAGLGKQLLRSGTSVAAHYREVCRAKSDLNFIRKLEDAAGELDESDLWLELLSDSGVVKPTRVQPLRAETNELIAIFVTMTKNVKVRRPYNAAR